MSDLVERLRKADGGYELHELNNTEFRDLAQEAAEEIERLRAALQAFVEHFGPLSDNEMLHEDARNCFRLARAALEEKK